MKAVLLKQYGGPDELYLGESPMPVIQDHEVLVKVHATALNRADILQRRGLYPPPTGESEILGLEMAGEIVKVGREVREWEVGEKVFALLPGGGYAEYVKVPAALLMKVPEGMDTTQAAGIAEAFLTAWQAVVWLAALQQSERILIHAGASGVGTAAIQIAKNLGAEISVTASAGKHSLCRQLGANQCIDYKTQDFGAFLADNNQMVNVIIDFIGAPYFAKNLQALQPDGRMVMLGFMGGTKAEKLNLAPVIFKRLRIMGSTLRARSIDYKSRLTHDFAKHCLPFFSERKMSPVIDSVFNWREVQQAHRFMEANKNQGKIILAMG